MATLEKIRSKSVLLLVIIGVALLAFIVGGLKGLNGSGDPATSAIAEINGTKIKYEDYIAAVQQYEQVYKVEMQRDQIDDQLSNQIQQYVWETMTQDILLGDEAEQIGLAVGKAEMVDMTIGNHPHYLVMGRRVFMDPNTGMFNKAGLISFLETLDKEPAQDDQYYEAYVQNKSYWLYFEKLIKTTRLQEKYNTLIAKALNANSLEAKYAFESKKNTVDVLYTVKPYFSVSDSTIKVTDEELTAKYEEVKKLYKQEENCDIKFVSFPITPSQDDFKKAQEWIVSQKDSFISSKDYLSYATTPFKDIATGASDIDPDLRGFAFSGKTGDVFGPMLFNDTYKMARIVESGISSPDSVNIRHIVVVEETKEKSKIVADSIINAIKGGADFATLAAKYSKDNGSANKGGEIGWMKGSSLSKELYNIIYGNPTGELVPYEIEQGYQILQATQKTANISKVKLAVMESQAAVSNTTTSTIYNKATDFARSVNNTAEFDKLAQQKGLIAQPSQGITKGSYTIANIANSRQIVRWAFESDKETVSKKVFEVEKQYIVAVVTAKNPKGYASLEQVKEQITAQVKQDKKAAIIIADMKKKGGADINAIALSIGQAVDTAAFVNFNSNTLGKVGFEPKVIAKAPLSEIGKVSEPIQGNYGVYAYQVINKVVSPVPYVEKNEKAEINNFYMSQVRERVFGELKDKAEIEDNRLQF